jgi:hypothetical protein
MTLASCLAVNHHFSSLSKGKGLLPRGKVAEMTGRDKQCGVKCRVKLVDTTVPMKVRCSHAWHRWESLVT